MNDDDLEPIGAYVRDELNKAVLRGALRALTDAVEAAEYGLRQARQALAVVLNAPDDRAA